MTLLSSATAAVKSTARFLAADGEDVGQNRNAGVVVQKNMVDSMFETATVAGTVLSLAVPAAAIIPASAQIVRGVARIAGTAFSQSVNGVHVGDAQEYKSGLNLVGAGVLALIPGYRIAAAVWLVGMAVKDAVEAQVNRPPLPLIGE